MQTTWNKLTSPVRSLTAGTVLALLTILAVCLGAAQPAGAQIMAPPPTSPMPIVVTGPSTLIGDLHFNGAGGGWFSGQAPLGGTFVVGANGDVIVGDGYGKGVFQITPSGTQTVLANFDNSNAAGMDKDGNVYIGRDYGDTIIKIPFVNGQYVGFSGSTPTTNCQGGDQTPCVFAPNTKAILDLAYGASANPGLTSLFFDGQGNFFFATDTTPTTSANANTIYECSVQCQNETDGSGTYPAVKIYTDPNAALGVVTVDPWGNLFFSDGAGNSKGDATYIQELPFSGGKYASKPTLITTYTSAAGYNGISGVVATNLGAIYLTAPNDGVYAIPNSQSGPDAAHIYKVSNLGGKGMTMDAAGNLYVVQYSNTLSNDGIFVTPMGNIGFGASPVGTATAATAVTVMDMAGDCTNSPPNLSFNASGEFAVTPPASGTCAAALNSGAGAFSPAPASNGASFPASIAFTPAGAGSRTADLVISDSVNSAGGMTALHGVGQSAAANVDPGVTTTYSTGLTTPASIVGNTAGDVFIADSGAGKVYEIAHGTATPVAIGSGFTNPDALALDAHGNLFIADDGTLTVQAIANTGQPGTFTAGTQTTIVGTTAIFGAKALGSAAGLAIGPEGTLYISDPQNNRVVYYNVMTGQSGVTFANKSNGLSAPMGLAVDAASNLYVADSGTNQVVKVSGGVISTVTSKDIAQAVGVAVDGSGSLLIADGASGKIVRVPNESGTLTTADAVTVETLASPASGMWADATGTLYVASGTGKAAYAIQRTSVSIDLGTVADGATGTGTIYLMNAGNETATLATPALTQPTDTKFLLAPAGTNGCTSGGSGPAGYACAITATFAPPAGSNDSGAYSDSTGAILISTPSLTIPITISGTASVSALQPQTITYNPVPPATGFIGQQFTLAATATSGLAVTFADTTPTFCTLAGSTVTFIATGTCTITANQAGGSNNGQVWGAAAQVTSAIVITSATPAGVPGMLMIQQSWLSALPAGGAFAGDSAAGTTFGVNPAGNVVIGTAYGNTVAVYDTHALAWTTLGKYGKYGNTGGVALDSAGNLYVGALYSGMVVKIPYNGGVYSTLTDATSDGATVPANCTGTDTAECLVAPISNVSGIGGVAGMTFDAKGDLFIVTDDQGANPHSIWECSAACLSTGTPAPVMLFQEPTGSDPIATGQLYVGGIAVDPWGNVFFTDSNFLNQASSSANNKSTYSDLYYLPVSSGAGFNGATTGYAATPTLLETFTNKAPGGYDDEIDGVSVALDGTVYYAYQYDGVFAVPNTETGGPDAAHQYAVVGQGAKEIALDAHGNLYYASYNNGGDSLGVVGVGNLTTPDAQYKGIPVNGSATVVDNAITCSATTPAALTFAFTGATAADFAGNQGSGCSSIAVSSGNGTLSAAINSASSYPATITFTPNDPGLQTASIAVSDTANGGVGSATVTALAQTTPQAITFTAPDNNSSYTYAAPPNPVTVTLTVANGPSNNPVVFSVDAKSTGAATISDTTVSGTNSTAMLTVTQAGTIIVDANEAGGLVSGVFYQDAPQVQLTLTVNQAAQTITFTPITGSPFTYAAAPNQVTLQLSATGGATGNPVTFTIDPSSTGAGTVSPTSTVGNASLAMLTITQAGSIVLDANQTGNANYAAATQEQQTIQVNQAAQTITFIPPSQPIYFIGKSTGIAGGIAVQVSAVGGGSNNAITFSLDPASTMTGVFSASTVSGATSTATLTIPLQGSVMSGTIVIDATQPQSTNYAAVTVTPLATLTILPPLPLQTITWGNPGTQVNGSTLTLTGTASSGFPITYTSSTTSVCTVSSATVTFAAAGTCTITASQPGDNIHFAAAPPVTNTFTVNATGTNPAMALNLSLNTLVLQAGTVGTSTITLTSQNNFTGAVVFSCTGAPSGYACTFTPGGSSTNPLIIQPNQSTGVTLAISPTGTASLEQGPHPFAPLATLAAALLLIGIRKRNRIFFFVLITLSVIGLGLFTGCGGSSGKTIQPTTSTVTVKATASGMSGASGSVSQTATLSVTVQ
jgi:sugar lactone lactonase YvrE